MISRETSFSFLEVLRIVKQNLSSNSQLSEKGLVDVEAEQLLMASYRQVTGQSISRVEFYSKMNETFPVEAADRATDWSRSRAEGKILQHIIGVQQFLNHEYEVGPDVLVPRPETEVLLDFAISELSKMSLEPQLGFEIGLGSGIISIELLAQYPCLRMVASELSPQARKRALENAQKILGTGDSGRLEILTVHNPLHVWEPFQERGTPLLADFMVTNPPYLASEDEVDVEVLTHEPFEALFAPAGDPLFFYRHISERAREFIKEDGLIITELPHERASEIAELFLNANMKVEVKLDLAQRERVLIAKLKEY